MARATCSAVCYSALLRPSWCGDVKSHYWRTFPTENELAQFLLRHQGGVSSHASLSLDLTVQIPSVTPPTQKKAPCDKRNTESWAHALLYAHRQLNHT